MKERGKGTRVASDLSRVVQGRSQKGAGGEGSFVALCFSLSLLNGTAGHCLDRETLGAGRGAACLRCLLCGAEAYRRKEGELFCCAMS